MKNNKKLTIDKQSISIKYSEKDKLSFSDKIIWYDIDEKGNVNKPLTNQAAVYIYMNSSILIDNPRYYIGSTIKLRTRISSHRYYGLNWNKYKYKGSGSSVFYVSVVKFSWLSFKFGILECINFPGNIGI